jgi:CRP/FNR family transcriptional regulator, cyclic AMP receptor protein
VRGLNANVELTEIPLFDNLSPEQLNQVTSCCRSRTFPADTTIMTIERASDFVYVILSGSLKIRTLHEDGSEVTLAILGPGEVVGHILLDERYDAYATMVETVELTTLLWLSQDAFQSFLQTMPPLTYNLVQILQRRLQTANHYMQSVLRLDVPGRLAHRLLIFIREYGMELDDGAVMIPMRLTQTDLAELIGASRVRVNYAFASFKRRGYLSVTGEYQIIIHNIEALVRLCA